MTPSGYLLDAGPLVALLNHRETHHEWAARVLDTLADASLLVLSEADAHRVVVTTDREDFSIYRLHRRQRVPVLMPSL